MSLLFDRGAVRNRMFFHIFFLSDGITKYIKKATIGINKSKKSEFKKKTVYTK